MTELSPHPRVATQPRQVPPRPREVSRPWLLPALESVPREALTVVCVPHAGAGPGIYRQFAQRLAPGLALRTVHLPGRESRINEPALHSVPQVVQALLPRLVPELSGRFALWGHSVGAYIAFEVARLLEGRYGMQAEALVVSGCQGPRSPGRAAVPQRRNLADEELWRSTAALNGIPAELARDPALRAALLPTLRADFTVSETYERRPGPPLSCPIHAFGGKDDPEAPYADVAEWRRETRGAFQLTELAGGHFFHLEDPEPFTADLLAALVGG